jgi:hypothetical protein
MHLRLCHCQQIVSKIGTQPQRAVAHYHIKNFTKIHLAFLYICYMQAEGRAERYDESNRSIFERLICQSDTKFAS